MPQIILKINHDTDKIHENNNICCYILESELSDSTINKVISIGKPVLFDGKNAINKINVLGDGIIINIDSRKPLKAQVRPIREKIGTKKIIGTVIDPSRHEAMLASETEPEFVAFRVSEHNFDKAKELIEWYNELFLIQCAVQPETFFSGLKELDVDFLIINSQNFDDFSC
ncbi:MAG: hypothetical protein E7019_02955 [Alphaproteobacteria bacterium]|nr:hypothetical protein [Alphaproteobacteria bacterium]